MLRTSIAVLFLSYYWTGLQMVLFHSAEPAFRRPMYTHGSFLAKAIAGAVWPVSTARNQEFGWFFSCFIGSVVAIGLSVLLLTHWLSFFWAVVIIGFIQIVRVPIISSLYTIVASFSAGLIAKACRFSIPESIERFAR